MWKTKLSCPKKEERKFPIKKFKQVKNVANIKIIRNYFFIFFFSIETLMISSNLSTWNLLFNFFSPSLQNRMLFELLVLSGAQVGSDWTSILKNREEFRNAFSGFDAETIATFTDKQMMSISSEYAIDISRVRGVVDNSNRILEVISNFFFFSFKKNTNTFFFVLNHLNLFCLFAYFN